MPGLLRRLFGGGTTTDTETQEQNNTSSWTRTFIDYGIPIGLALVSAYLESNNTRQDRPHTHQANHNHAANNDVVNTLWRELATNTHQTNEAESELREIAQNRENSMRALSSEQERVLGVIKNTYRDQIQLYGVNVVIEDMLANLERKYEANPARSTNGQPLPLAVDQNVSESDKKQYYKHKVHTAWRYFQRPSPFISPNAGYIEHLPDGTRAALINRSDKESLAYLWLAVSDSTISPEHGFTHETMQEHFFNEIAFMMRRHNWDRTRLNTRTMRYEEYDDLDADKPSCSMGVTQGLLQSAFAHPAFQQQEARNLNANIIKQRFESALIAENDEGVGVYNQINFLGVNQLNKLNDALESLITINLNDKSDLSDDELAVLNTFKIPATRIEQFKRDTIRYFGQNRVQSNARVEFMGERFNNYMAQIDYMANNVEHVFYNTLKSKIQSRIHAQQNQGAITPQLNMGQSLVNDEEPSRHSHDMRPTFR